MTSLPPRPAARCKHCEEPCEGPPLFRAHTQGGRLTSELKIESSCIAVQVRENPAKLVACGVCNSLYSQLTVIGSQHGTVSLLRRQSQLLQLPYTHSPPYLATDRNHVHCTRQLTPQAFPSPLQVAAVRCCSIIPVFLLHLILVGL